MLSFLQQVKSFFVRKKTSKYKNELQPDIRKNSARILPNISHHSFSCIDDIELENGKGTYEVLVNNNHLNFFANVKGTGELMIFLPGATSRKKGNIDFQRYSWADDFPNNVVVLSDPTINESNALTIGWFQGKSDSYVIKDAIILIKKLNQILGVKNNKVLFFGSSAGGYVGLKLVESFHGATVIAFNPQIFLYNYSKTKYQEMLEYSYHGMSEKNIRKEYNDRLAVIINDNINSNLLIFQNKRDLHHMNKHIKPLLMTLPKGSYTERTFPDINGSSQMNMTVFYYDDAESGHSPPDKKTTIEMINFAIEYIGF